MTGKSHDADFIAAENTLSPARHEPRGASIIERTLSMESSDIARVQTYLRKLFGSDKVNVVAPPRKGATVELAIDKEVIGTVHRDEDEGEVSFSIIITVLEEDLAPAAAGSAPAKAAAPAGKTAGTPRR